MYFPPQNQIRDFNSLKFTNNSRHSRRLLRLLKPQTNGTTGPPRVNDDGSRFLSKSNPFQISFFYLDRSLKRWGGRHNNEKSCQRQRKKPAAKMKNQKMCWEARQRIDNVFVSRLVLALRKGNVFFNIMYGKLWNGGDLFGRNLDANVELHQHQSQNFLFSRKNGTLSFFFGPVFFFGLFFFYPGFSSSFDFSTSKDFSRSRASTCEFC